ncbi:MAG TPA: TetR/AcrR family transcriptional regulator [Thermoanaerobaculia bacterium]|nr:TetR/AcrR family transcriptional regulator [Thermoanaerobaculia bacterium]
MPRHARAEQSRRQVLDAALQLFSHRGYRATTVRDIADEAGVSTGNVYHHFEDKEQIFRTLLDEFMAIAESKRYPFTRALANGRFPDNLEQLALAARDSIREFRPYIALIYVDVIEFDGTHIQKFYTGMAQRFTTTLTGGGLQEIRQRLRSDVSPVSAMLLSSRIFFNYFSLEILFNVPQPFGKDSMQVIREICEILRNGMLM